MIPKPTSVAATATAKLSALHTYADRLHITHLAPAALPSAALQLEAAEVINGLTQTPKTVPCRYFYDDRGSQLFEQICQLPEYYLTRTEGQILQAFANDIADLTGPCELVELGSGSARKTRYLLDAYTRLGGPLWYAPIDISAGILETSAQQLLQDYPQLQVRAWVATYEQALANLPAATLPNRLVCFLGSTLGNFSPAACDRFFQQVSAALQPGDYCLLGVDLQKDVATLEAAYNDRQGVTAAFNLNLLSHLNRRFAGNFAVEHFQHRALYNTRDHQIEMYLDCQQTQTVRLQALGFATTIASGEAILTEVSRKFELTHLIDTLQVHTLHHQHTWTDPHHWFALVLCQRGY
ncbi:L-histidine N(alpha)-methyltransferase [Trichothermofontia sp.]